MTDDETRYRGVTFSNRRYRIRVGEFTYRGKTAKHVARVYDLVARQLYHNPIFNFLEDGTLNPHRLQSTFTYSRKPVGVKYKNNKFSATIKIRGKKRVIGRYDSAHEAAQAYDFVARESLEHPLNFRSSHEYQVERLKKRPIRGFIETDPAGYEDVIRMMQKIQEWPELVEVIGSACI